MKRRMISGALLAAFSPVALAGPDATPVAVARVEIVGTLPFAQASIDRDLLPYPVQVADREALRQADNLTAYMARTLNGVNVNDIAGSPFQVDVTYRGYRAHRGAGLGLTLQWGGAEWRFDYSYLRATYDADGSLFTGARTVQVHPGTPVAGLPRHTLKLGVDWEAYRGLTLGANLQAQSAIVALGNEDGLLADPGDSVVAQRGDWSVRGFALLNLQASWKPAAGLELFGRISNALDRRYETYAAIATDMFPNGQLLRPDAGPVEPGHARFVAPGAPRLVTAGLRYRF